MLSNKKRILLTGASGAIGYQVAKQLLRYTNNFELVFFDLNKLRVRRKLSRFRKHAKIVYGDIRNRSEVKKACQGIDVAIHLAAIIPLRAYLDPTLTKEVNHFGTRTLVECLEETSPGSFLLYSSSIAVYGDRLDDFWISINDRLKPSPGDNYAETKIEAERIIIGSKLSWSIFRLTAIMGNHKPSGLMFYQPLATKLEISTTEDTGRAFVKAISHLNKLEKKIFNLGGGESCRIQYDEFLNRSFRNIGLGAADFPKKAFADYNFHCGYYSDSDELNDIIKFRNDDLKSYLKKEKDKHSGAELMIIGVFRRLIKWLLLLQSPPYRALKRSSQEEIKKFFK